MGPVIVNSYVYILMYFWIRVWHKVALNNQSIPIISFRFRTWKCTNNDQIEHQYHLAIFYKVFIFLPHSFGFAVINLFFFQLKANHTTNGEKMLLKVKINLQEQQLCLISCCFQLLRLHGNFDCTFHQPGQPFCVILDNTKVKISVSSHQ